MLGILSNIFGSGDVVKKGLELIDEAWTSDEEKAENEVIKTVKTEKNKVIKKAKEIINEEREEKKESCPN